VRLSRVGGSDEVQDASGSSIQVQQPWSSSATTVLPEIFGDGSQAVSHFFLISSCVIIHYRKALKVAELKDILNKASVPFDAKTQKASLIKKIQESPAALAIASGDAGAETAEDDLVNISRTFHANLPLRRFSCS
jgi:hypothetical protein